MSDLAIAYEEGDYIRVPRGNDHIFTHYSTLLGVPLAQVACGNAYVASRTERSPGGREDDPERPCHACWDAM